MSKKLHAYVAAAVMCMAIWIAACASAGSTEPDVKLLVGGEEAFSEIIQQIRSARESVAINMFIWRDDRIGNRMAQEVLAAAQRGVKIRISKDLFGAIHEYGQENKRSFFHQWIPLELLVRARLIERLYPEQGVSERPAQHVSATLKALLEHPNVYIESSTIEKDHAKYFIFDDQILILGGINIEDKELYKDIQGQEYFDFMVRVTGKKYVEAFFREMQQAGTPDQSIRFIHNNRLTRRFFCKGAILDLLKNAQSSLLIANAYWGDRDIIETIIRKANAGVEVTVFIPHRANIKNDLNHKIMTEINYATNGKVTIYRSAPMLHAKAIVCDDRHYLIGSCNLNRSSLAVYSEANILLSDAPGWFKAQFGQNIDSLKQNCQRVTSVQALSYHRAKAWFEGLTETDLGICTPFLGIGGRRSSFSASRSAAE